jgi:uncharacterized protein YacL
MTDVRCASSIVSGAGLFLPDGLFLSRREANRMQAWLLRILCLAIGAIASWSLRADGVWALLPFLVGVAVVGLEVYLRPERIRIAAPVLIGTGVGLALTVLSRFVIMALLEPATPYLPLLTASLAVLFVTLSILVFHHRGDMSLLARAGRASGSAVTIMDTSVIIDGRLANICRTGFLEGEVLLPRFILKELQYIADSADTLRRNKGRRGLDVLSELRGNPDLTVRIAEETFPDVPDVDAKLVALAKARRGRILTNDYNLKTIAELQGVTVLNVNELATAVKPEILQGEVMSVRIIREGKEPAQGVAYLDDGTMVVVDNARQYMHHTLSVEVTSVLQTSAGRMIFARIRNEHPRYEKPDR